LPVSLAEQGINKHSELVVFGKILLLQINFADGTSMLDVYDLINTNFTKIEPVFRDRGFFENISANHALTVFLQALIDTNFE